VTYCVVRRNPNTLAVADANDPRVGVYVKRADSKTFWDYVEACDHGKKLASEEGIFFSTGSILE
jgi:hypothetical protein